MWLMDFFKFRNAHVICVTYAIYVTYWMWLFWLMWFVSNTWSKYDAVPPFQHSNHLVDPKNLNILRSMHTASTSRMPGMWTSGAYLWEVREGSGILWGSYCYCSKFKVLHTPCWIPPFVQSRDMRRKHVCSLSGPLHQQSLLTRRQWTYHTAQAGQGDRWLSLI